MEAQQSEYIEWLLPGSQWIRPIGFDAYPMRMLDVVLRIIGCGVDYRYTYT